MAISFRNIPPNLRVPLAYFEFDPSLAGTATSLQKAVLLGSINTTDPNVTLEPNHLTEVFSADQVRALAGIGSALGHQAEAWFRNNASVPLSLLAAEEAPVWNNLIGSIEWTSGSTDGGVIPLYIGGRLVRIVISGGMDPEQLSRAAAEAINADLRVGVVARAGTDPSDPTVDPEVTVITAAQRGELGRLKIEMALAGAVGGEIIPAGVGYTITQMPATPGAIPDVLGLLAEIGDAPFDFVLCPWTDANSLNALREFFNDTSGRWSWVMQLYGHGWCAREGTVGELSAVGNTRNDQHVSIMGFSNSSTPADEWMAAYAGQSAGSLIIDPARPVQALPLIGIRPPPREFRFTILERQVLYYDGISATYVTDGEEVYIDRVITTYRRNVWGAPDDSYLDVETMYTAQFYARSARNRILLKFPRHKLASDGTRFGAGQAIVTPKIARAELIAHYGELEEQGIVEDMDGFERALIVERSATDPNRLNALVSPSFVNQLRIFAVLVQFRLHGMERVVA